MTEECIKHILISRKRNKTVYVISTDQGLENVQPTFSVFWILHSLVSNRSTVGIKQCLVYAPFEVVIRRQRSADGIIQIANVRNAVGFTNQLSTPSAIFYVHLAITLAFLRNNIKGQSFTVTVNPAGVVCSNSVRQTYRRSRRFPVSRGRCFNSILINLYRLLYVESQINIRFSWNVCVKVMAKYDGLVGTICFCRSRNRVLVSLAEARLIEANQHTVSSNSKWRSGRCYSRGTTNVDSVRSRNSYLRFRSTSIRATSGNFDNVRSVLSSSIRTAGGSRRLCESL